ncbi:MAG: hypothetical protein ACKER6_00095 [Candidatus Hodgkinia cicadicola]
MDRPTAELYDALSAVGEITNTLLTGSPESVNLALANQPFQTLPPEIPDGRWFVGCIRSRSALFTFKIFADSNIYRSTALRALWMAMNEFAASAALERISVLKRMVASGVMLHLCLALCRTNGALGLVRHGELCPSVHESACLVVLSSYTGSHSLLSALAVALGRHLLPLLLNNSAHRFDALLAASPFGPKAASSSAALYAWFEEAYHCKLNIQRLFALTQAGL